MEQWSVHCWVVFKHIKHGNGKPLSNSSMIFAFKASLNHHEITMKSLWTPIESPSLQ
jgi:hypothetical protein